MAVKCSCGVPECAGAKYNCLFFEHQEPPWQYGVTSRTKQPVGSAAYPYGWQGPFEHTCCDTFNCSCYGKLDTDWHYFSPTSTVPEEMEKFYVGERIEPQEPRDDPPLKYTIFLPGIQEILVIPELR